jgi:D-alanyl-D-alanine carboxypeptidase/D-alanyl-D-alanine-endopeptidase (penicillin-binding protein 4)
MMLLFLLVLVIAFLPIVNQEEALFVTASDEITEAELDESATLHEKLNAILSDVRLDGTVTGVSVRKADTGEEIFSQSGDIRVHPASNMKLLTSAAALETLGADHQFTTEVLTDGKVKGKVLQGNLYLKGKGDPTLMKADLDQFAVDLKEQGITKIKGNLIGDDHWYDDHRLSMDLNWNDEPFYTGAQVSALTLSPNDDYDSGTVIVKVMPAIKAGKNAQKAKVKLTPETDYVEIINKTEMVAEDEKKDISIEREHGTNNIIVKGKMPQNGAHSKSWVAVWEPTGYALDVFKKSLTDSGIQLIGNGKVKTGKTAKGATVITDKKSMPLKDLLIPFMKLSNNGHGETLTKEMGKVIHNKGTWEDGLMVINEALGGLGVNTDTILLRDGSGMSHKTVIPAAELSQMLYTVQEKDWFPAFEKSLPVAGIKERLVGGTLRDRMKGVETKGNVKAKTGSLTGVSSLSGYVTAKNGEKLVFSIMINNYLGSPVTSIEDKIATVLAKHEFTE